MVVSIGSTSLELYKPIVSADDRLLAFEAHTATGNAIYVRRLDSFELFKVPGEGRSVFFSPDNTSLGLFRGSEVWTVDLAERVPIRLGELPEASWDIWYAVWHPDGRILVTGARGLWALQAGRSEPALLAATDSAGQERFEYVGVLPDGRILLEVVVGTGRHAEVVPSDGGRRIRVFAGLEQVRTVDDVVLYVQAGQLRSAFFDPRRLEPIGPSVALPDPLTRPGRSIVWVEGSGARNLEPVWVSVQGTVTPVGLDARYYRWPRVSPDGMRIAFSTATDLGGLHTAVVRSGAMFPISGWSEPVFSSDGRHVFTSRGNRPLGGLIRNVADGSRAPDTLLAVDRGDTWPTDASRDGRWLAYYGATLGTGEGTDASDLNDLMFMDLSTRESRRLRLPGAQRGARFSPDGRWVAYQSTEKGTADVFVRPWPELDAGYQISSGGGTEPLWAPDGKSIYYRHRDQVIEVPISVRDGAIERGAPRVLFAGVFHVDRSGDQSWDIARDGRFLMLRPVPGGHLELAVTLNWIGEVRARLERAR